MSQLRFPGMAGAPTTLPEAFSAFHAAHPEVLDAVIALARARRAEGHKRYSIKAIFERLRWDGQVPDLNNNFHAFYARLAMETAPDLDGFFELRAQRVAA